MITIALVQADIKPHQKENNFRHYEQLLADSLKQPIDLLVLPEMFACGFSAQLAQEAETMKGTSMQFLQRIAKQYHTYVVATLPIKERGHIFNRLVWFAPNELSGYYDKINLFPGEEQQVCTAGKKRCLFISKEWRCLPLICYDVRFPVLSYNYLFQGKLGYDLLFYVCNFPAPREKTLRALAVARAIENQAYVLVVNRIGEDGEGREHFGGTAVISPQGEVLQTAGFNREQVLIHALDRQKLSDFRASFPG